MSATFQLLPLIFALFYVNLASRTLSLFLPSGSPATVSGDHDHLKALIWSLFDTGKQHSLPTASASSALDVTVTAEEFDPKRNETGYATCWGDPSARVTLLTVAIGLQDKYLETLRHNRISYAVQQGAEYCECHLRLDMSREAPWTKVLAIQRLFEDSVNPRSRVLWLDADALVMNGKLSIFTHIAARAPHKDAIFSTDLPMGRGQTHAMAPLNSGVIYMRNTPWSRSLLERMYKTKAGKQSTLVGLFDPNYLHEQSALMELRAMDPSEFTQHAEVVPWDVMNSIGFRNFCEGDFVLHIAGGGERWLSWLLGVYWPRLGSSDKYMQLEEFIAKRESLLPLLGGILPRCGWFHPPQDGPFQWQDLMMLMNQSPYFYLALCVTVSLSFGLCCCFWGREYQRGIK